VKISIIIPTLNEEKYIGDLLNYLSENSCGCIAEIIVCDGNSIDLTRDIAQGRGARVIALEKSCRAVQMNAGARVATGEVIYFVHADTRPPNSFIKDINSSILNNYDIGGYRFKFDSSKWSLKFNSWMTRFNILSFRGGDQSLFLTKKAWEELGGFDEKFVVMEEYDLLKRASLRFRYCLIQKDVIVSARKYDQNSWLRVNFANTVAMIMFRMNYDPQHIKKTYSKLLKNTIIGYHST